MYTKAKMSQRIINEVIVKFERDSKGPLQLSPEWFVLRERGSRKRGRIGGSDVASLLGYNPYRSRRQLLLEKQGLKKKVFGHQFPLLFGSIFEEVAVNSFEKIFKTKVMCKNITIVDPKGYDCMVFSPDGLCALPMKDGDVYMDYDSDDYDKIKRYAPVLIEVKCPSTRPLTRDAKVPKLYYPQIQAGMFAIDVAHSAIFIDNQLRVCSYQQLFSETEINNVGIYAVHSKSSPVSEDNAPVHIGAILVYGELPPNINRKYLRVEKIGGKLVYDLGNATYRTFTDVLGHMRDNAVRYEYLLPYDSIDDLDLTERIKSSPEKDISIICWKLFDATYTLVQKDYDHINELTAEVRKYNGGDFDIDEDINSPKVHEMVKRDTRMHDVPKISFDDDTSNDSD